MKKRNKNRDDYSQEDVKYLHRAAFKNQKNKRKRKRKKDKQDLDWLADRDVKAIDDYYDDFEKW